MREEFINQVALSLVPGLGPVTLKQLISHFNSAFEVWNTPPHLLKEIPGVRDKMIQAMSGGAYQKEAVRQIELAGKYGASILTYAEPTYPKRLRNIDGAPTVLYMKGYQDSLNNPRTIGIVGTRKATDYGKRMVRKLLSQLKIYQPTIISGLAYGIDVSAHHEALKLELPTVAVLGSSIDKIYPAAHKNLVERMLERGSVISELKFGTKAEFYHFPSRNRIIAGLSDALILVESREEGGALITADYLRKYGRPCFAVPGPIDSPASAGCNQLLKSSRAHLLTNGSDIANLLEWTAMETPESQLSNSIIEAMVTKALVENSRGLTIDQLSIIAGFPLNKMAAVLLAMELKGAIKSNRGGKFSALGK